MGGDRRGPPADPHGDHRHRRPPLAAVDVRYRNEQDHHPRPLPVRRRHNYTAAANGLPNVIPSGTPLGKVTANGLYGPYDSAATDGTQTFAGLLEFDVAFNTGSARVGAALRIVGDIDVSQLPVAFTVPAAANRTDHLVFSDLS
ncbi:head decoration protein [Streptomyces sp. DHE17-7]|uniref:head decoration protein n=1 Tax=Streptomyces sp. DHE17-7 TaxID=2759949 RepID=UPI0022EB24F6|nr:head decoration protein [Streptomyces sp. DHE17-7]